MDYFLNLHQLPKYYTGAFRAFEPGEHHVNRRPPYSVLILMLEGTLIFVEDGTRIELAKNEWYIQRSGLLQEGREASLSPKYFYIHFFGAYQPETDLPAPYAFPLKGRYHPGDFFPLFQRLEKLERESPFSDLERQSIFFRILDQLRKSAFPSAGAFSSARRIAEYLGEHFGEEIKLSQLAGEFSYSTDHMIRIFKQHFQMTPHQYLIEVRTSEAKRLLLSTDWPMDQIASAAGFRDLTAFYRDFKQKTGISPGKWRRRMQGLELPQS